MPDAIWLTSYPPGVPESIDPDAYPSLHAIAARCLQTATASVRPSIVSARRSPMPNGSATAARSRRFCARRRNAGRATASRSCCRTCWPTRSRSSERCGPGSPWSTSIRSIRRGNSSISSRIAVPSVIVIMENFAHKLATMIANTPIEHVVVARLGDLAPSSKRWAYNFANTYIRHAVPAWDFERFTMLQDACKRPPSSPFADAQPPASAPALLQYTGGTTGVPKGAILSHRNLVANTLQCRAWIGAERPAGEPSGCSRRCRSTISSRSRRTC